MEDFDVGACRALEAANKSDKSIVLSIGNDTCFGDWDKGTSNEWVATVPIYAPDYAGISAAALVALMDKRVTADTLWKNSTLPGDFAPQFMAPLTVVTRGYL